MKKAPPFIAAAALLQGGYMLFDGIHKLTTGAYFGNRLGPWANMVSALGVSPDSLGPVFVALGILWLVGAAALLFGASWARRVLLGAGVVSLLYVPFGTILSLIVLVLVLRSRRPAYL